MYASFFTSALAFAFLYAYYIPTSEKAPHPKSRFRVGRLIFSSIYAKAAQSNLFFTTYVVLPSGISGFCSKIEHLTDFNLSVAASIVILML